MTPAVVAGLIGGAIATLFVWGLATAIAVWNERGQDETALALAELERAMNRAAQAEIAADARERRVETLRDSRLAPVVVTDGCTCRFCTGEFDGEMC